MVPRLTVNYCNYLLSTHTYIPDNSICTLYRHQLRMMKYIAEQCAVYKLHSGCTHPGVVMSSDMSSAGCRRHPPHWVWQNTTLSAVMSSDMSSAGLRRHPPHQCGKTLISVRWCRLKMSSCQASIFWVILLWNSDKYKFVLSSHNHGLVTLFWHHYDVIHTT